MAFRCDHPFTPENQVKVGTGRVGCRTCRRAARQRRTGVVRYKADDTPRPDPDARLRRWSWEPQA